MVQKINSFIFSSVSVGTIYQHTIFCICHPGHSNVHRLSSSRSRSIFTYEVDGGLARPLWGAGVHAVDDLCLAALNHVLPERRHAAPHLPGKYGTLIGQKLPIKASDWLLPDADCVWELVLALAFVHRHDIGAGGGDTG